MFKKVYIEITNICNKNCSFCSKSNRNKKEMTLEEFEKVLININGLTNYVYLHVKGEPLLHSEFNSIIKLCEKYNLNVNITTNGTLLEKQKEVLLNKSVKRINISLHSFEGEDSNLYIDEITDMIKFLKQNENLNIQLRFWALNNNELGKNNEIMLNRLISNLKLDSINISEVKNIKLEDRLYLNKGDIFCWPTLESDFISDVGRCYGTIDQVAILSDGTVVPCCLDAEGVINLGNIFEISLKDIVNTDRFKNMKQGFFDNQLKEELCKKCQFREMLKK